MTADRPATNRDRVTACAANDWEQLPHSAGPLLFYPVDPDTVCTGSTLGRMENFELRTTVHLLYSINPVSDILSGMSGYEEAQGVVINRILLAPCVELSPESRSNEFPW
jgi:hypothetical protein